MAKSLRSKKIRAHKAIKRNEPGSVFRQTHDARTARLSAKIEASARGPKRPRSPSPAIEVVDEDGDEAPMAVDEGAYMMLVALADLAAEPVVDDAPADDAPAVKPLPTLRSNERKKLRKQGKLGNSKSAQRTKLINSFRPSRSKNRRSKSGTAKA